MEPVGLLPVPVPARRRSRTSRDAPLRTSTSPVMYSCRAPAGGRQCSRAAHTSRAAASEGVQRWRLAGATALLRAGQ